MSKKLFLVALLFSVLSGCVDAPPKNKNNICSVFRQYPHWYWSARESRKQWGVPISVMMAFMYQESRFNATALPPRDKIFWIIPWFTRVSSSYGYTQAVDGTWAAYKRDTGARGADRDAFEDAVDFVGWYGWKAHKRAGISRNNAYSLYLAYHEGIGGYMRDTYRKKRWLIGVARKVQSRARMYKRQLIRCESSLPTKPWWYLW